MPYRCGCCKRDDDAAIEEKRKLVQYDKLQKEFDMLRKIAKENELRKMELERLLCKIPKEHCEDCKFWYPAADAETETELSRMLSKELATLNDGKEVKFEGRDYIGVREAVFFLYSFYQQVTNGYLDMIKIDTDVQKEDLDAGTKKDHQKKANKIFYDLRARLTKYMDDFSGVIMSI